jgi:hypothetical protein
MRCQTEIRRCRSDFFSGRRIVTLRESEKTAKLPTLADKALGRVDNEEQCLSFMLLIREIRLGAETHPATSRTSGGRYEASYFADPAIRCSGRRTMKKLIRPHG